MESKTDRPKDGMTSANRHCFPTGLHRLSSGFLEGRHIWRSPFWCAESCSCEQQKGFGQKIILLLHESWMHVPQYSQGIMRTDLNKMVIKFFISLFSSFWKVIFNFWFNLLCLSLNSTFLIVSFRGARWCSMKLKAKLVVVLVAMLFIFDFRLVSTNL